MHVHYGERFTATQIFSEARGKKTQAIIATQEVCVCEGRWPEAVKADFMLLVLGPWVAWKADSTGG